MVLRILQVDLSLSKHVKHYLERVSRVSQRFHLVPSTLHTHIQDHSQIINQRATCFKNTLQPLSHIQLCDSSVRVTPFPLFSSSLWCDVTGVYFWLFSFSSPSRLHLESFSLGSNSVLLKCFFIVLCDLGR